MSDNAFYTVVVLACLAGFAAFVGGLTGYFAHKNTVMAEMIKNGADPLRVRAMMDGERLIYIERQP